MTNFWPPTTIGALFDIGAGKSVTPHARHGERKHPFLRTSNVFWGHIDTRDVDTMHFTDEEITSKSLQKGDLLVCEGGDIGRSAIWNNELKNCSFQNHLHRLRPKNSDIQSYFYMYYLQAGFTQLGIYEGAGNKTTIPNLSRSRLASLAVPYPTKIEQKKIAFLLSKVRVAIDLQDKLIAAITELKQTAIIYAFTRGLHDERQKESDIGLVPESWAQTSVGENCDIKNGYAFESKDYVSNGILNFRVVNIREEGRVDIMSDVKFLPINFSKEYSKYLLQAGNILLVMVGATRGKICLIKAEYLPALMNQNMWRITPKKPDLNPLFLYYYLSKIVSRYMSKGAKDARGFFKKEEFRDEIIFLPTSQQQNEIAVFLSSIDRKLDLHKARKEMYSQLFSSLLNQLMTEKIRVSDLDIDTSDITS